MTVLSIASYPQTAIAEVRQRIPAQLAAHAVPAAAVFHDIEARYP